jgi:hypothetical protein
MYGFSPTNPKSNGTVINVNVDLSGAKMLDIQRDMKTVTSAVAGAISNEYGNARTSLTRVRGVG